MNYPLLTMTGIDERTSTTWIKSVAHKVTASGHQAVEFGILRSPKVGQSPRYPTREIIKKFTGYVYPQQLAFHLCGRYAEMVHTGEWAELCDIIDFGDVGRVQVNSTKADAEAMLQLQRFSVHIDRPVIMQWREGPFPSVPGVQLLQDRSGGRGVVESEWFSPDALCQKTKSTRIGFAGGLTPDNVAAALPAMVRAARGKSFWIDCESGVRTGDWFDQGKAEAMIAAVLAPIHGDRVAFARKTPAVTDSAPC